MRKDQFQRPKGYNTLMLLIKTVAILYLLILTGSYLTSDTKAYFSDQVTDKQVIQAGEWWDQSELEFTGEPTQNVKACPPTDIAVQVRNNGVTMAGTTTYEVYYSENGNPKNNGEKIADGTIDPIATGETSKLSFHAEKTGTYMFKAIQRPGYDGDDDTKHAIWSEKVTVECIEKQNQDQKKEKSETKQSDESESMETETKKSEDEVDKGTKADNKPNSPEEADKSVEKDLGEADSNQDSDAKEDKQERATMNEQKNETDTKEIEPDQNKDEVGNK